LTIPAFNDESPLQEEVGDSLGLDYGNEYWQALSARTQKIVVLNQTRGGVLFVKII
jgi:hypothetical protein